MRPKPRQTKRLRKRRKRKTPTRRSIPDTNDPLPHKLQKSPIGNPIGDFCARTAKPPRPDGRGGRQICDRAYLCALPLDALRGVLEHDAGGLELVADAVGLGPVFGLAGGLTRGDLLLDGLCLGVLAAV